MFVLVFGRPVRVLPAVFARLRSNSLEAEGEQQRGTDPREDLRRDGADETLQAGFRDGDDMMKVDGRIGLQSAVDADDDFGMVFILRRRWYQTSSSLDTSGTPDRRTARDAKRRCERTRSTAGKAVGTRQH